MKKWKTNIVKSLTIKNHQSSLEVNVIKDNMMCEHRLFPYLAGLNFR
jgi:hypothetical protein